MTPPADWHPTETELVEWLEDRLPDLRSDVVEQHLVRCDWCARQADLLADDQGQLDLLMGKLLIGDLRTPAKAAAGNRGAAANGKFAAPSPRRDWGRWRPLYQMTAGGLGEIWMAQDATFCRRVVVKCLRPEIAEDARIQERFIREAHLTAELNHPGTPYVLEVCDAGPQSYYVMSLVEGTTLSDLIARFHQQLHPGTEVPQTLWMTLLNSFIAVAQTLASAHLRGVIHRDIKSDNVLVGDFGQVALLDWGLGKRIDEPDPDVAENQLPVSEERMDDCLLRNGRRFRTLPGVRLGTPSFMAPEQVSRKAGPVDARTDVYGLSAMLYEILSGRPPFVGLTRSDVFSSVLGRSPRPLPRLNIAGFAELEAICLQGLRKNPEDRPVSAGVLAASVQRWIAAQTERRQIESARQRFFDFTNDLLMILDSNLNTFWTNTAWQRLLGWRREDLQGNAYRELVHPADRESWDRLLDELANRQGFDGCEYRMRHVQGRYRWVRWTAIPMEDEDHSYLIGRDEDQRYRRQRHVEGLLDTLPDAWILVAHDGAVQDVNQRATTMFQADREALLNVDFDSLFPHDEADPHRSRMQRFFEDAIDGEVIEYSGVKAQRPDHSSFRVSLRLRMIETPEGRFVAATMLAD